MSVIPDINIFKIPWRGIIVLHFIFFSGCSSLIAVQPTITATKTPIDTFTPTSTQLPINTHSPVSKIVPEKENDDTWVHYKYEDYVIAKNAFEEYLDSLITNEKSGGSLVCDDDSEGVREEYSSCTSFRILKNRGCYGLLTTEMIRELQYAILCEKINALEQASISIIDYFYLESKDWWKDLPAEVIPMRAGIYEQEQWEKEMIEREELVTGRLLGDIDFVKVATEPNILKAIVSMELDECGTIIDLFYLKSALLADFDGDGISELLLEGYRAYQSESCFLGSGNNLGGSFFRIINKDSPSVSPTIISYFSGD